MCQPKHKLTKEGLLELKAHREGLLQQLEELKDQISENSLAESLIEDTEYLKLVEEKLNIESEIAQIDDILETTQLVRIYGRKGAHRGSFIKLENHKICHIFQLVDHVEANPLSGKISTQSPIGQSLVGKGVGDEISMTTPSGTIEFKIVAIN